MVSTINLEMRWEYTSCSDIFGCDVFGWYVDHLCEECADLVKRTLIELGVVVQDIED